MNEGVIARRYAKALFRYAGEQGRGAEVYEEMKALEGSYVAHPELHRTLQNPMVSPRQKEMLLATAVGATPSEEWRRLVGLLVRNHRETCVLAVSRMYQRMYREANGIERVRVLTARELPEESQRRIMAHVEGETSKRIEFVHEVDESLIGGFVLQVGSRQLDASIRRELRDIGRQLVGKNVEFQ